MNKKKACKKCKMFVEGEVCPNCKGNQFTSIFQGRINVLDAEKSEVGKKINIDVKGEYAIRIR